MQLREIKISELNEFVHSELYKQSLNIPITKQRVISQIKNPRANKNNIALIIAINKENQIVGFIGALPDSFGKNLEIDFYWNSCWWIDQKKGKKTAIPLLLKFLKVCDNKVMLRDMTDKTRQIISRLNKFETIKDLKGFRYFIKLNSAEILPKRKKIFVIVKPILLLIDYLVNFSLKIKNKSFRKTENIQVKYLNSVDDETEIFLNKLNKKELFKRGKDELNWILNYPWVIQGNKKNTQFYYFSETAKKFENYLVKIYKKEQLIGVLLLNNHDGLVKIPYIYFKQKDVNLIVQFIYQFLEEQKAISLLTFNKSINKAIQNNKNPFWKINEHNKEFVVSKSLAKYVESEFNFQDGEGDYVFT